MDKPGRQAIRKLRFRWLDKNMGGYAVASATLSCPYCYKGSSKFEFVLASPGDQPKAAWCPLCGEVIGISQEVFSEVQRRFELWSAPQTERKRARKIQTQRKLADIWQLARLGQPDPDIRQAFVWYGFNMLQMFYAGAKADEARFCQMVAGDWGQAILGNLEYASKNPCTAQAGVGLLLGLTESSAEPTHFGKRLVRTWRKMSWKRFHRFKLTLEEVQDWWHNDRIAWSDAEISWLLKQLETWRPYKAGQNFRILPVQHGRQLYYWLETMPANNAPRS